MNERTQQLNELIDKLEESKHTNLETQLKIDEDILRKADEILRIRREVQQKNEEMCVLREKVEQAKHKQEEAEHALGSSFPQHVYIVENDYEENDDEIVDGEVEAILSGDDDIHVELPRPEHKRVTQVSKKKRLEEQLLKLRNDLALVKDSSKVTTNDLLYGENIKNGRDKYKIMREITMSDAKRRVDQFDNL